MRHTYDIMNGDPNELTKWARWRAADVIVEMGANAVPAIGGQIQKQVVAKNAGEVDSVWMKTHLGADVWVPLGEEYGGVFAVQISDDYLPEFEGTYGELPSTMTLLIQGPAVIVRSTLYRAPEGLSIRDTVIKDARGATFAVRGEGYYIPACSEGPSLTAGWSADTDAIPQAPEWLLSAVFGSTVTATCSSGFGKYDHCL